MLQDAQEDDEKEKADDELDAIGIPTGWRQCPRMGQPIDRFIPMKVSLQRLPLQPTCWQQAQPSS